MISLKQTLQDQAEQRPDTIKALREWVIPHSRVATPQIDSDGNNTCESPDQATQEEFHAAPSIALSDAWPAGRPQQATVQNHIGADNYGVTATQDAVDLHPQPSNPPYDVTSRPSVAGRVLPIVGRGFIIVALVGVAIALLSDETIPKTQNTAETKPAPTSLQSDLSLQVQNKLETMAGDLAAVRAMAEQLADRQDRMAQDITTLQIAEQTIGQQVSTLNQVQIAREHPHSRRHYSSRRSGG